MYVAGGSGLLGVALYYQYRLNELPCVLCIHVRLWIALLVLVGVAGLLSNKFREMKVLLHTSVVLIAVALAERSYQLLGTERGFVEGECGFDIGLPSWFAIEQWLPWLFRVETSCGYTPVIMFGITMAESLMVMSVMMLLVALSALAASFCGNSQSEIR
ncbi:MAG: disulfide bond formation protein B [Gammaproteobacteria bacterium]|nr:disulfide bond formation protein B [Gammaproteobacteria bacterium]